MAVKHGNTGKYRSTLMNDWKHLFRTHILERGWNYHEMGAITSLDKTEGGYRAVVEGSEEDRKSVV